MDASREWATLTFIRQPEVPKAGRALVEACAVRRLCSCVPVVCTEQLFAPNAGDVDGFVALYEAGAAMVRPDGVAIEGHQANASSGRT